MFGFGFQGGVFCGWDVGPVCVSVMLLFSGLVSELLSVSESVSVMSVSGSEFGGVCMLHPSGSHPWQMQLHVLKFPVLVGSCAMRHCAQYSSWLFPCTSLRHVVVAWGHLHIPIVPSVAGPRGVYVCCGVCIRCGVCVRSVCGLCLIPFVFWCVIVYVVFGGVRMVCRCFWLVDGGVLIVMIVSSAYCGYVWFVLLKI